MKGTESKSETDETSKLHPKRMADQKMPPIFIQVPILNIKIQ